MGETEVSPTPLTPPLPLRTKTSKYKKIIECNADKQEQSPKPKKRRIKEEEPIVIEDSCDDSEIQFGRHQGSNCLDDTIPVESCRDDSIKDDSSDSELPDFTMSTPVCTAPVPSTSTVVSSASTAVPSTSTAVDLSTDTSHGGPAIYRSYVNLLEPTTPDCSEDDDDEDLQAAITQSLIEQNPNQ
ncbi:uncharacterized protein [Ptychodera flava]|uniref:uncharacterized protein n=1 Tax=Ptychodera flava TaxID=63121 RepID=UPI00396AA9D7